MEADMAPKIESGRASVKPTPLKEAFVSKRGSVVILKGLVAEGTGLL